jgi:hypothetical protein
MKWTPWIVGSLCIAVAAGCNGNRRDNNTTGSVGTTGDTASMQSGAPMANDTSMQRTDTGSMQSGTTSGNSAGATTGATGGTSTDTARSRAAGGTPSKTGTSKTKKANQTKSGVTDTKTGASTLGKGVTTTRPDQGQPVTSKGDTIGTVDSSKSAQ